MVTKNTGLKEMQVAVRLRSKEIEKLKRVMEILESLAGECSTSTALRYIVAHFDIESSPLGKVERD